MIENGKAKIENLLYKLSISIPSRKNWVTLIIGTFGMVAWYLVFTIFTAISVSGKIENSNTDNFTQVWIIAWGIGGISNVLFLLWGYFGKEKFISDRSEVLFEKTIFGIGQKKRLNANEIKNIRTDFTATATRWFGGSNWTRWGLGPGKTKFDYGLKTFSFGLGVDDAEAVHIVELMKEHFRK